MVRCLELPECGLKLIVVHQTERQPVELDVFAGAHLVFLPAAADHRYLLSGAGQGLWPRLLQLYQPCLLGLLRGRGSCLLVEKVPSLQEDGSRALTDFEVLLHALDADLRFQLLVKVLLQQRIDNKAVLADLDSFVQRDKVVHLGRLFAERILFFDKLLAAQVIDVLVERVVQVLYRGRSVD